MINNLTCGLHSTSEYHVMAEGLHKLLVKTNFTYRVDQTTEFSAFALTPDQLLAIKNCKFELPPSLPLQPWSGGMQSKPPRISAIFNEDLFSHLILLFFNF